MAQKSKPLKRRARDLTEDDLSYDETVRLLWQMNACEMARKALTRREVPRTTFRAIYKVWNRVRDPLDYWWLQNQLGVFSVNPLGKAESEFMQLLVEAATRRLYHPDTGRRYDRRPPG